MKRERTRKDKLIEVTQNQGEEIDYMKGAVEKHFEYSKQHVILFRFTNFNAVITRA